MSKIKFITFKYKCLEYRTDLIIYLIELLQHIDVNRFKDDIELRRYVNTCLDNKGKQLYIISKKVPCVIYDIDTLNNLSSENNQYDEVVFEDLIKVLPLTQRKVIYYKYNKQFTDKEIALKLDISRQAVNKANRLGLNKLKNNFLN